MKQPIVTLYSHPQPRDSGDYLHRVQWPGRALAQHLPVQAIQSAHPDHLRHLVETDILVINMVADAGLLSLIAFRRECGRPTVYEISDDFQAFPPHLPMHGYYSQPGVQTTICRLASACNAIQFSSPALQQKYGHLNSHSVLFMNHCNSIPPLPCKLEDRLVVGWSGSVGHYQDAQRLAGLLSRWDRRHEVQIAIMAAPAIHDLFIAQGITFDAVAPGSMSDYLQFVRRLDIGIAILHDDAFNQGRSDGKFLEYAANGAVAVCSKVGTYTHTVRDGETGFLFDSDDEFHALLSRLVTDGALRATIQANAHRYCQFERNHQTRAAERARFYLSLLPGGEHQPIERSDCGQGYHELIWPLEHELMQAMTLHQQNRPTDALTLYARLLESAPSFPLIWERMGQALSLLGDPQSARTCQQTATELSAKYHYHTNLS